MLSNCGGKKWKRKGDQLENGEVPDGPLAVPVELPPRPGVPVVVEGDSVLAGGDEGPDEAPGENDVTPEDM